MLTDNELISNFTIDFEQKNMYVITLSGYIYKANIEYLTDLTQLNWKKCPVPIPGGGNNRYSDRKPHPLVIVDSVMHFYSNRYILNIFTKQNFDDDKEEWLSVFHLDNDSGIEAGDSLFMTPNKNIYLSDPTFSFHKFGEAPDTWHISNNNGIADPDFPAQPPTTYFDKANGAFANSNLVVMVPGLSGLDVDQIVFMCLDGDLNNWPGFNADDYPDIVNSMNKPPFNAFVFKPNLNAPIEIYFIFQSNIFVLDYHDGKITFNKQFDVRNIGLYGAGFNTDIYVNNDRFSGTIVANFGFLSPGDKSSQFTVYAITESGGSPVQVRSITNNYASKGPYDSRPTDGCFRYINTIPVYLNWDGTLSTVVKDVWQLMKLPASH